MPKNTGLNLVTAHDIARSRLAAREGEGIAASIKRALDYQRELKRAADEKRRGEWKVEPT